MNDEIEKRPLMAETLWHDSQHTEIRKIQIGGYWAHIVDDGELDFVGQDCEGPHPFSQVMECRVCHKQFCVVIV